jgi:hypothetical protein
MLSSSAKNLEVIGDKIRSDSYYGYTDGQHTVQFFYNNFIGGVGIQGTLSLDPTEKDWFWIRLNGIENFDLLPYLTFPKDPLNPTGFNGYLAVGGDTGSKICTFKGNFTFLRAVVTRNHVENVIENPTDGTWMYGQIDRVLLCL